MADQIAISSLFGGTEERYRAEGESFLTFFSNRLLPVRPLALISTTAAGKCDPLVRRFCTIAAQSCLLLAAGVAHTAAGSRIVAFRDPAAV